MASDHQTKSPSMTGDFRIAAATLSISLITASVLAPSPCEALECGDVNQDGSVFASDAFEVLRKAVGLVELTCPTGLPATGRMTPNGTGSDGDVQAGNALSFVDNGDGTAKDNNPTPTIHDTFATFTWSTVFPHKMDRTIKTVFLDTLNDAGSGTNCFAGYCDWRIPNSKELYSLFDLEVTSPAVDPALHQGATCGGCTDITLATCSCTTSSNYWTSTSWSGNPDSAWYEHLGFGSLSVGSKTNAFHARAVRGGL
jgi:hypothetical protein